ncbi:hypothetical protein OA099_00920 [Litorivicinus sp.]|nr:hypothetical protein [Litorivicinus sp.]
MAETTWEYNTIVINVQESWDEWNTTIDQWGTEGWEMVGFHIDNGGYIVGVFKKAHRSPYS